MFNENIAHGEWIQMTGDIKAKWGRLTDDDLKEINGNIEKLTGKIQKVYGITVEEAKKQITEFEKSLAA